MVNIVTLIGIALDSEDEKWVDVLLLSDYTTTYVIEKVLKDITIMECKNQKLINKIFEAYEWLSIHKPCEKTIQYNTLMTACLNDRIDLIEKMIKIFKKIPLNNFQILLSIAKHHNRADIYTILENYKIQNICDTEYYQKFH